MNILARTQMLSQYPLLEIPAVIHRLGFDGAEICMERIDWTLHDLDSLPIDALRERLDALGLHANSFSMHRDYVHDDDLYALMQRAIPLTPRFGTCIFVFSDGPRQPDAPDVWDLMIERTRQLVQIAEDHGVIMAKEFEGGFVTTNTADLLRMFEEIPSPNLAANLDLGHTFILDPDPFRAIAQLGSKIVHCHISNMPKAVHDHLLPQEGDMDLSAFLAALSGVGFDGPLALDLYKYNYEDVAADAVKYLRGLMNT